MKIRCPHCANAVEVIEQTSFDDVACEACGSHFSLVDQQAGVATLPPQEALAC